MKTDNVSVGIFIDGGYYAKIDDSLVRTMAMRIDVTKLIQFVRDRIAAECGVEKCRCQVTESH